MAKIEKVDYNRYFQRTGSVRYGNVTKIHPRTEEGVREIEALTPDLAAGFIANVGDVLGFIEVVKVSVSIDPPKSKNSLFKPQPPRDRIYCLLKNEKGNILKVRFDTIFPYLEGDSDCFDDIEDKQEWEEIQELKKRAIGVHGSNLERLLEMYDSNKIRVLYVSSKMERTVAPFKNALGKKVNKITLRYFLFEKC
ncbi:hypothetical protein [Cyclobacterium plantarum]|uniref:hypothetical protein n=1 Tax=Cyclobacterium plantarum TaxID=2716263 RepID=UPI003F6F06BD